MRKFMFFLLVSAGMFSKMKEMGDIKKKHIKIKAKAF